MVLLSINNQARLRAFEDTVFAEDDLLHVRRIRQVGADEFHLGGHFGRGTGGRRAFTDERIHDGAAAIVDNQFMPGLHQVAGHGRAHDAQTDISDFRH